MNTTSTDFIAKLSEFYKIFGDPTRLRILKLLETGERTVTEITEELGMNQSAISHQLKLLKINHLVKGCKCGKNVHYSLNDDHIRIILSYGFEHILEKEKI